MARGHAASQRTAPRMPASAVALLAGVVDYAGLFPPAALTMAAAAAEYARAQAGPDAWMLGRFVVPASRLDECSSARTALPAGTPPWALSAIVRDAHDQDREAVTAFNAESASRRARIDSIECKPASLAGVDWLGEAFGPGVDVYVEVPAGDEAAEWLERVRARRLRAKVRTGGLTADAFPSPAALGAFIDAALRLGVPFKATAGLHHAVRGTYRLTYGPDAETAPMYGYLNVLLATAARVAGMPVGAADTLLRQTDSATLRVTDAAIHWGDISVPVPALAAARAAHLMSFGSCSFREPADELRTLTQPADS